MGFITKIYKFFHILLSFSLNFNKMCGVFFFFFFFFCKEKIIFSIMIAFNLFDIWQMQDETFNNINNRAEAMNLKKNGIYACTV